MIPYRGISSNSTNKAFEIAPTAHENKKSISYFCSTVEDHESSFFIRSQHYSDDGAPMYREELNISRISFRRAHSHPDLFSNKETSLPSATPFHLWAADEIRRAAEQLRDLGLKLRKETIEKVYLILRSRLADIVNVKEKFPADFHCEITTKDFRGGKIVDQKKFTIQIHSERRATLFFENDTTFIEKGGFKSIKLGYALGNPQLLAYSLSIPSTSRLIDEDLSRREEYMFKKFDGCPWIAQVHDLFYYQVRIKNIYYNQQCIQMHLYPRDLFKYIEENIDLISPQEKWSLQLQILRALNEIHKAGVVHRDVKPENFLIESGRVYITDFGMAMEMCEPGLRTNHGGSLDSKPPEMLLEQIILHPIAIDSWGAGCTIWNLFFEELAPWINEDSSEGPSLEVMFEFDSNPSKHIPFSHITNGFLIWNLLRYSPTERLSPAEVLKLMENINSNPMRGRLDTLKYFESLLPLQLYIYLKSFQSVLPKDLSDYLSSLEEGINQSSQLDLKRKHSIITPETDPELTDRDEWNEEKIHKQCNEEHLMKKRAPSHSEES